MFTQFPILYLLAPIIVGFLTLAIITPLSTRIGLVDHPNQRKLHTRIIPLTGGVSIFAGIVISLLLLENMNTIVYSYLISVSIIFVLGVLDDIYDISSTLRLIVQFAVAFFLCYHSNIQIENLGNLFNLGEINLGGFSYIFTSIVIVASINAFNLLDGVDGLLGSISLVAFSSIGIIYYLKGDTLLSLYSFIMFASIIPYLLLNIGSGKYKVFSGDSGSMIIGLSVIWLLMLGTRGEIHYFSTTTALWIVGLPFMDMVRVMIVRKMNNKSIFEADRNHLHHVLENITSNAKEITGIVTGITICFSFIGIVFDYFNIPLWVSLTVFLITFYLYIKTTYSINRGAKLKA